MPILVDLYASFCTHLCTDICADFCRPILIELSAKESFLYLDNASPLAAQKIIPFCEKNNHL